MSIPWREIVWYLLYRLVKSSVCIGFLEDLAWLPIDQGISRTLDEKTFDHVMSLSTDYHENERAGGVHHALSQTSSINHLIRVCLFYVGPSIIDMLVAVVYLYTLFGPYMGLIAGSMGILYFWLNSLFDSMKDEMLRKLTESGRHQSNVLHEAISSWFTVFVSPSR